MNKLEGKTVVVVGATGGIGSATVDALVKAGANVAMMARTIDRLETKWRELGSPEKVIWFAGDASDTESVENIFSETENRFKSVDGVFISIGDWEQNFSTDDPEELEASKKRLRESLVTSVGHIAKRAVESFEKNPGAIIHISSHVVHKSESELPGNHVYREMKQEAERILNGYRTEQIQVANLRPSIVNTPKNERVLTKNGLDCRSGAVAPETIANWVVNNLGNPNAQVIVKFESDIII